jgi:hypothetical protein
VHEKAPAECAQVLIAEADSFVARWKDSKFAGWHKKVSQPRLDAVGQLSFAAAWRRRMAGE